MNEDLRGQTFHQLRVVELDGEHIRPCGRRVWYWSVLCLACGSSSTMDSWTVRRRNKTCGCGQSSKLSEHWERWRRFRALGHSKQRAHQLAKACA